MKSMYKYELAEAAGVSRTTFNKWCKQHAAELLSLGCKPKSHLLNPAAVRYLCEKFCIVI